MALQSPLHTRTPACSTIGVALTVLVLVVVAVWSRHLYQTRSANHTPSPKGAVWAAAHAADAPGVLIALARGASTEEADENGVTALMAAIRRGASAAVRTLLLAGADVLARDRHNSTPVHEAARSGHPSVMLLILAIPTVDPTAVKEGGWTPLHRAAAYGHVHIASMLLADSRVTDLNPINEFGRTPLHEAAFSGNAPLIRLLLSDPRVDVGATDKDGLTPLGLAQRNGEDRAVGALEEHLAAEVAAEASAVAAGAKPAAAPATAAALVAG